MKKDYTKVHYAQEYSHLVGKNLSGRSVVVWGHPDIPMYASELVLDEEGNFLDVGKSLLEEEVLSIVGESDEI